MRKFLVLYIIFLALTAWGEENESMLFTMNNGEEKLISSRGLIISFSGDNLVASDGKESITFPLTDVASMQFSSRAGVEEILNDNNSPLNVYTYDGINLGKFENYKSAIENLGKGTYIFKKSGGGSFKIMK